jgi:hypothetical protein
VSNEEAQNTDSENDKCCKATEDQFREVAVDIAGIYNVVFGLIGEESTSSNGQVHRATQYVMDTARFRVMTGLLSPSSFDVPQDTYGINEEDS